MLDALAVLTRACLYAGLLSAAGAVLAGVTLQPRADDMRLLNTVIRRGAWLAIVADLMGVLVLLQRLGGRLDEPTMSALSSSSIGAAAGLQVVGAILMLFAARDMSASPAARCANAAIALSSFAFSGHAAAVSIVEGLVAMAHVAASAWWLGSLWLLRHLCACADIDEVGRRVQQFSRQALRIVGGLVIVGSVLVIVLVDFERPDWLTPYVRLLAVKLAAAAVVLGAAGYNKLLLTPRLLTRSAGAVVHLRRMVHIEITLIACVLAITAALTTYTSPHE
jgi:putative copper resistance protein D